MTQKSAAMYDFLVSVSFYDLGGFKYNLLQNLKPNPVICLLSGENHCVFDFLHLTFFHSHLQ
jgi:hypothetical protein